MILMQHHLIQIVDNKAPTNLSHLKLGGGESVV